MRGFPEQLLQQQADAGFSLAALAGHDQHLLRLAETYVNAEPGYSVNLSYDAENVYFSEKTTHLGTGFAGMSAAAVISPMLITFLDMPAYEAVGIALASRCV